MYNPKWGFPHEVLTTSGKVFWEHLHFVRASAPTFAFTICPSPRSLLPDLMLPLHHADIRHAWMTRTYRLSNLSLIEITLTITYHVMHDHHSTIYNLHHRQYPEPILSSHKTFHIYTFIQINLHSPFASKRLTKPFRSTTFHPTGPVLQPQARRTSRTIPHGVKRWTHMIT